MTAPALTAEAVWQALEDVKDPEIPVVSLVEMGIVRAVAVEDGRVRVTMTPTFSGCPALHAMRAGVEERLRRLGATDVAVELALSPRWTTDWISEAARAKLKAFGLAPPPRHGGDINVFFADTAACPYCGSAEVSLKNTFGPTLCRTLYYCNACRQPFEAFKPI